jgi:hypothetical protein
MIQTTTIRYAGANIEIPSFLVPLWPRNFPLDQWPSFCGAGDGLGDRLIPDHINNVRVACCCFVHDIDWCMSDNSFSGFMRSNLRLWLNLRNVVIANDKPGWFRHVLAERKCFAYFAAVSIFGHKIFTLDPKYIKQYEDPTDNPAVREKIHRLARVCYGIPGFNSNGEST